MAKPWKAYGRYGSVGMELIFSIAFGYWLGTRADAYFHRKGQFVGHEWFAGVGFVVGVYAGFRTLFRTAAKMQRDIEIEERKERERNEFPPPAPPLPPLPPRDEP